MKIRIMTVAGLVCMLASAVGAQTKFTGTVNCAKPDPNYTVDAGDHPGHSFTLVKESCKWTDTLINGMKITDDTGAATGEAGCARGEQHAGFVAGHARRRDRFGEIENQ